MKSRRSDSRDCVERSEKEAAGAGEASPSAEDEKETGGGTAYAAPVSLAAWRCGHCSGGTLGGAEECSKEELRCCCCCCWW